MDKRLEAFLQKLVRQVHGEKLPVALEQKMVMDLNLQLQQKLHEVSLAALSNEVDRIEYQNLVLGEVSADTLGKFLHDRVPDLNSKLSACVTDFQNDYIKVCQSQV
ncbi:MAG: hypothetical protein ACD_43C00262G0004 [uncultured bacterium]|nr:MAG: hypothetical protein ACD_43C00262G0004 [uncultured bacterium]